MSRKPILAWWFGPDYLPHGDGRKIEVGKRLMVKPPLELCHHGLHGSRRAIDALQYVTRSTL